MANSIPDPYHILGIGRTNNDSDLRFAYRTRLLEFKEDRLKLAKYRIRRPEDYQLLCRVYETLSDRDKKENLR